MFSWRHGLWACLALLIWGCGAKNPTAVLDAARSKASSGSRDGRTLAFAGFHALWVEGKPAQAQTLLNQAVSAAPEDPYALYGQMLLGHRTWQTGKWTSAALALCEKSPTHPLSTVSARALL